MALSGLGADRAVLRTLCGVMDLPSPIHDEWYLCTNKTTDYVVAWVQTTPVRMAAGEEYQLPEDVEAAQVRNRDVPVDGS